MSRLYFPHRQAYAPRRWVAYVCSVPLWALEGWLLTGRGVLHVLLIAVVSFVTGVVAVLIQYRIWKRKHPIVDKPVFEPVRRPPV